MCKNVFGLPCAASLASLLLSTSYGLDATSFAKVTSGLNAANGEIVIIF